MSDLTIQYLDKLYDDLQREHQNLLTSMKYLNDDSMMTKETEIQKQMTIINTLMMNTLKFKNLKKKLIMKQS